MPTSLWRNWRSGKRNDPFEGKCTIAENSSMRKLKRAIRRGKVPSERMLKIEEAMKMAIKRKDKYVNSHARER
jgi:hypothetical protein